MKTLIIGGTGLISTAITRCLVERGDEVMLYNRGRTPAAIPGEARVITGNRQEYAAFELQMAGLGPIDCVVDMACYQPDEAESVVRAFAGRAGQVIFCSTVDVYSRPTVDYPIREDAPCEPDPTFDYGRDKARCEAILKEAAGKDAFAVTIIRPAHTYGEGRGLVHTLGPGTAYLDRIRKGKPIVVHGDGSALRVSCHRDDAGRAFAAAAGNPAAFGKSYNVTGEEWMTWNQYHQLVARAMGAPAPALVHIPTDLLAAINPRRALPAVEKYQYNGIYDNGAARRDLDFRYTIPFVDGVRRVVAWLDEHGGFANSDDDPFEDHLAAAWSRLGAELAARLDEGAPKSN